MGCAKVTVTLVLALAIGFGFILNRETPDGIMNKPIPDDISNPLQTVVLLSIMKMMNQATRTLSILGFGDELTLKRKMSVAEGEHTNLTVTDTTVDGVKVRVYVPDGIKTGARGIVFYHGGGWAFGSVDTHDIVTETLARRVNAVVMSVEYRLAPEHPFPIPLDDCTTATKYFIKHASEYGVDPKRIAIAGDSAGGTLAAAIALRLRDEKFRPMPRVQVLAYPCVQGVDTSLPSFRENEGLQGNAKTLVEFFQYYLGIKEHIVDALAMGNHTSAKTKKKLHDMWKYLPKKYTDKHPLPRTVQDGDPRLMKLLEPYFLNPYMFPLMASDHSRLPDAYIATTEYDLLRDEGMIYAGKLREAKVKVTLAHEVDGMHGILNYLVEPFDFESGKRMMNSLVTYLLNAL